MIFPSNGSGDGGLFQQELQRFEGEEWPTDASIDQGGPLMRRIAACILAVGTLVAMTGCGRERPSPATKAPHPSFRSSGQTGGTGGKTPLTHSSLAGRGGQQAAPAWNRVILAGMDHVAPLTSVPLEAPLQGLPPSVAGRYLTAITHAVSDHYAIDLWLTASPMPINNPAITQPPNGGQADLVGGFGATTFPSHALATASLRPQNGAYNPITSSLVHYPVNLGDGVQATFYSGKYAGFVQWTKGKWTIQINNLPPAQHGSPPTFLYLATHRIVAYLHTHPLPTARGLMVVQAAGDGDHTSLQWVKGSMVLQASNYHSAVEAIMMATSMRSFPGAIATEQAAAAVQRYRDILATVSPVLTAGSSVPVLLPVSLPPLPFGSGSSTDVNAQYQIRNGYRLTLSYGPALPVNSPKIQFGNAEFLATIMGMPAATPLNSSSYLPLQATVPNAAQGLVDLGQGVAGTNFVGNIGGQSMKSVTWQQRGWTFGVLPADPNWGVDKAAAGMVKRLQSVRLPATHGQMVFSFGTDAPAEAVFQVGSDRYVLETMGWDRLLALVGAMKREKA